MRQAGLRRGSRARHTALPQPACAAALRYRLASGGQDHLAATGHLSAINQLEGTKPWKLRVSYGRALQDEALKAWRGKDENLESRPAGILSPGPAATARLPWGDMPRGHGKRIYAGFDRRRMVHMQGAHERWAGYADRPGLGEQSDPQCRKSSGQFAGDQDDRRLCERNTGRRRRGPSRDQPVRTLFLV